MKYIIGIVGFLVLCAVGVGYISYALHASQFPKETNLRDITIKEGDGLTEVAELLEEKDVIRNGTLFRYAFIVGRKASLIQTGNYELSPQLSILEVIDILTGGSQSQEGTIVISEGLTNDEIAEKCAEYFVQHSTRALASENDLQMYKETFLSEMNNVEKYRSDYSFLSSVPEGGMLEGYLFPDTYRFFKETEPEKVIRKMLDNFELKLTKELRIEITSQGKSIHEVVILASIVQNEVSDEYMKDVAGVFYNRLKIGKKLQSDATVNYITGKNTTQPTFEDTGTVSPYNTYEVSGLPPGPISNPGMAAIEASIFPAQHDYYFFLTKPDTGEPVFSQNGEEHLQNKEKYLDE